MVYEPITTINNFDSKVKLGETKESLYIDFKGELNPSKVEFLAIDIAAFANTYGGSIIFGISEKTGTGIANGINPNIDFESIRKFLNEQVRDKIKPIVRFETIQIKHPDGVLAVVNIEPQVNLVGVCTNRDLNSFCHPYRTEFGNRYFEYMEVEKRMNQNHSRNIYLKMLHFATHPDVNYEINLFPKPKGGEGVLWYVQTIKNSDHEFILQRNHGHRVQLPYSFIEEIWRSGTISSQKIFSIKLKERLITAENLIDFHDPDMIALKADQLQKFNDGMSRFLNNYKGG